MAMTLRLTDHEARALRRRAELEPRAAPALQRTGPQATAFGADAYPDLDAKAAAVLRSLARNRALADGNKRLALAAVIAFCGVNGRRLRLTNDEACELVMAVADGMLDDVEEIAGRLAYATKPW